ncbi:MAG: hypothetical protein MPN21_10910 [Thermoanaerobaculia bacterium]|nr:hypothetical protein [Thermoanaerobaculia bacterium]
MKPARWLWLLLGAAAIVYLFFRGGGPEEEIRKQVAEVEELLEKPSGEASLAAVDRANRLGNHFTEEFSVVIEPYGQSFGTRRDLIRGFVAFRRAFDSIEVGLRIQEIQVSGSQAETSIRATFFGTGGGGGPSRQAWDAVISWQNAGGWKIETVQVTGQAESVF